MASIDPRSGAVVIRIVYDGAPLAGKTSSLRALGAGLGHEVVTPAEVDGRTLYFDWLDYTGGLFEGRRIRCQIVSVPGQSTLAPRRRSLLEKADVVVFVGDSSPEGLEADGRYLIGLTRVLGNLPGPPVGFVFQANKRDHPQAVTLQAIRDVLDGLDAKAAVVESVAPAGTGIREAFVFAVRLALDRVRELMRSRELQTMRPLIDDADELLAELRASERGAMDLAASDLRHTSLADTRSDTLASDAFRQAVQEDAETAGASAVMHEVDVERRVPALPDYRVASGLIWPPIGGRTILHELAGLPMPLRRTDEGGWLAESDARWRVHSPAASVFHDIDQGRAVLIQSARACAASGHATTLDRCLVLAADGLGRFRLWQLDKTP